MANADNSENILLYFNMKQWDNDFQKGCNPLNVDSKCFQMKINYSD